MSVGGARAAAVSRVRWGELMALLICTREHDGVILDLRASKGIHQARVNI
jgi:hypothetical protein